MPKFYSLQELNFLHHTTSKVGILGGTFNPAHIGHLMISKRALDFYKLDYVVWLVANQNPFKKKNQKNIFERANQSLNLIQDENRILVSTAEYDLNTIYTYDSISLLLRHFSGIEFTWMMGIDNVVNFSQWHRSDEIPKLCDIIIFDRLCSTRDINISDYGLKPSMNLDNVVPKDIIIDNNELYNISSTQIREQQKKRRLT